MRRPSVYTAGRRSLDVAMTPMIDVVFLLLVFFVWTASFQVMEYLLPSSLLSAAGTGLDVEADPERIDFERVVVHLSWRDNRRAWTVNRRPVESLDQVRQTLESVAAINSEIPVVLDPEVDVPIGHVIDVYDIARQVGFDIIQFATVQG
jgi:biopolymer transport protein ExbD